MAFIGSKINHAIAIFCRNNIFLKPLISIAYPSEYSMFHATYEVQVIKFDVFIGLRVYNFHISVYFKAAHKIMPVIQLVCVIYLSFVYPWTTHIHTLKLMLLKIQLKDFKNNNITVSFFALLFSNFTCAYWINK